MKKYNEPVFNITLFDDGSVITMSGGNGNTSYDEWTNSKNAQTADIDLENMENMANMSE